MSAIFFSLNQSKTKFLLIGLPKQMSEVSNLSLLVPSNVSIAPSILHVLWVSFLTHQLPCLIIFHLYLNLASSTFDHHWIRNTKALLLLKLLLYRSFIPSRDYTPGPKFSIPGFGIGTLLIPVGLWRDSLRDPCRCSIQHQSISTRPFNYSTDRPTSYNNRTFALCITMLIFTIRKTI